MGTIPKNFGTFALAFFANWFSAMSGSASVPLAIAAYFVDNRYAKIGLAITAAVCFMVASYLVWKRERETIELLQKEIDNRAEGRASLEVRFGAGEPYRRQNQSVRYWNFEIHNCGPAVAENVTVKLVRISSAPDFPAPSVASGMLDFPLTPKRLAQDDLGPLLINRGESVPFQICQARGPLDNGLLFWEIDGFGSSGRYFATIRMWKGWEHEFEYEVLAKNAARKDFAFLVETSDDGLVISRIV